MKIQLKVSGGLTIEDVNRLMYELLKKKSKKAGKGQKNSK